MIAKCKDCGGEGEHADELTGDSIVLCMRCGGSGEEPGEDSDEVPESQ